MAEGKYKSEVKEHSRYNNMVQLSFNRDQEGNSKEKLGKTTFEEIINKKFSKVIKVKIQSQEI